MSRSAAAISPTAHYTGHIWSRHGLSHPALGTATGRLLYLALSPYAALSRLCGGPTPEAFLLLRHRLIDDRLQRAIEAGRVGQVVEIAAGLSPRGWRFKQRYGAALRYIETDLPAMAARKRETLRAAGLLTPGHEVLPLDAMAEGGAGSLAALIATLEHDRGLAIITEGLVNYFDREAVTAMWSRFATALSEFPHGLYLSDLHLADSQRGVFLRAFGAMLSVFVRGRVHFHFRTTADARRALIDCGFDEAELHQTRDFAAAAGLPYRPGAELVHVIEARTGASAGRA
jgi:O-methyltransferase involved in polyketide biosynthesis